MLRALPLLQIGKREKTCRCGDKPQLGEAKLATKSCSRKLRMLLANRVPWQSFAVSCIMSAYAGPGVGASLAAADRNVWLESSARALKAARFKRFKQLTASVTRPDSVAGSSVLRTLQEAED